MKALLVDDHALFREGFKLMLERHWPAPLCIVEAGSAESGLEIVGTQSFDIVFLDFGLPGLDGLDGLCALRAAAPSSCIVVLSAVTSAEIVRQALLYGAQGYIPKTINAEAMREALDRILDGQVYAPAVAVAPGECLEDILTARQVEVLIELCAGRSNREIGDRLGMSENTVRAHASAMFRTLGVRSRTEAALLAKRKGLS
ncbi:MAG: hypothetical protein BGO63_01215 [Candidatus Accumulibacter sp. 66-26]|nr:response regulator transcription factor [Accumulibacter sp.]OJW46349.1 MAG: hypothetical protein BGO63_01215 [Candidatus Accumulibacter sp. 66-26]